MGVLAQAASSSNEHTSPREVEICFGVSVIGFSGMLVEH
ncbi:hypothetical protein GPB2148_295 [marine gamma proteobacterium HTCC2148]|nr:hypothetical protein GPB2148_295 [marine gamma proteobacterium HTCC2148]